MFYVQTLFKTESVLNPHGSSQKCDIYQTSARTVDLKNDFQIVLRWYYVIHKRLNWFISYIIAPLWSINTQNLINLVKKILNWRKPI